MAKVFVKLDAEFQFKNEDQHALNVMQAIEYKTLAVFLHQKNSPTLFIGLNLRAEDGKEGSLLEAVLDSKGIFKATVCGVFKVEVDKKYIDFALSSDTLWLVSNQNLTSFKAKKGIVIHRYENYYGPQKQQCYDLRVAKTERQLSLVQIDKSGSKSD